MSTLFSDLRGTFRPGRPTRRRSLSPSVDGLDERCLLSAGMGPHVALVACPIACERNGVVIVKPCFYEDYVGPRCAQLEAREAIGQIQPNGSFTFIGINVRAINPKLQATYVFGIDRWGKLPTGPFPDRPDIRFDATVVIKLVPGLKPTVKVNDLATKKCTTLVHPRLVIEGNLVAVNIPGKMLPSTGLAPSQFCYAYWTEDGCPGSTHIASFAPNFHDIKVGMPENNA
jgi:hypothetical protein